MAACGAPKPVAPKAAAPAFKITQSFSCPYPARTGDWTIEPDGKAEMIVFNGFEPPPKSQSARQKKTLAPKDMADLSAVLARTDYKAMPEWAESYPPRHEQSDPCSHTLEIESGGVVKAIHYRDGDVPDSLVRFVKAIDDIVDRTPWQEDVYPWGKP